MRDGTNLNCSQIPVVSYWRDKGSFYYYINAIIILIIYVHTVYDSFPFTNDLF